MKHLLIGIVMLQFAFGVALAQDGLIAYYPFNGNANDESGNNYDGDTTEHAPELATDRFGNPNSAYSFDGVDDFIDVPFELELRLADPFTISTWIYVAENNALGSHVLSKSASSQGHRNYSIELLTDRKVNFIFHQYPNDTAVNLLHDAPLSIGLWHQITALHEGTSIKLYIDNTMVESTTVSTPDVVTTYLDSPQNLAIGRLNYNGPDPGHFFGLLDDIHIYNRALTVTEIDSLYHEGGWDISAPLTFTRFLGGAIVEDGGSTTGVSWVDYNNDGLLDLFAANGGNNFLYTNNGDGTFTKVTSGSIVTDNAGSIGGTWSDYDNDGDLDLYVANESSQTNNLYMNNGDGSFTKVTTGTLVNASVTSYGAAWADYDNDGDLDLFVANIGFNSLFNNDGAGNFTPVENDPVVTDGPETHSLNGAWGDYNRDGYLDLFVGNGEESGNYLYTNDGDGTFTKVTSGPVVNDGGTYCGAWADYNNDGFLDLFATKAQDYNSSRNNYLYKNNGDGTFTKITAGAIVNDGGWSHGCGWADYDNDGYVDLFVANFNYDGNFSYENFLYRNNGDETFSRVFSGQVVSDSSDSRGVAWGDYDSDGDLDLFIGNAPQNNILYINEGNGNNWLSIHPVGTISNTSAIGAKVWVKASINSSVPIWQLREISSCTGYGSQNSLDAEFGLGLAPIIDSVRIEWPSGIIWDTTAVQVNQFLTIFEHNEISDGLVAYYPFNGNANDESGNSNNGTVYGAQLIPDRLGNANSAYSFDGVNDYIVIPNSESFNIVEQMSLSYWVKLETPGPYYYPHHMIEKYGSWGTGQRDWDIMFGINSSVDSTHNVWNLNLMPEVYYNVTTTYNGEVLYLYVNGSLVDTNEFQTLIPITVTDIVIGKYTLGEGYYFDGVLDDIRIYNRALSPDEVSALYNPVQSQLSLPCITATPGDTILVPVQVNLPANQAFDSAELQFTGYQSGLQYVGIDVSGSMLDGLDWSIAENETDSLLFTAYAGSQDISGNGVFCNLRFVVTGDQCTTTPINIVHAVFNTTEITNTINGSVHIEPLPIFGDVDENGLIQAHDAALILKHTIGIDTLLCQEWANADVDTNGVVGALDASNILRYVVQLIDSLPVTGNSPDLLAEGSISMNDQNGVAGETLDLPVYLTNGGNILSFQGELTFNASLLSPADNFITWSGELNSFSIETDLQDGHLKFAAASANPDGQTEVFAILHFIVSDNFLLNQSTTISLDQIKLNENIEYNDIIAQVMSVTNVNEPTELPREYALSQNFPNPFNPTTTLRYDLPEQRFVHLTIYNQLGQPIRTLVNREESAGYKSVVWDARDNNGKQVSTGIYFYRIEVNGFTQTRKMVLLK